MLLSFLRVWEDVLNPSDCVSRVKPPQLFNSQNFTVDLRMPGVLPTEVSLSIFYHPKSTSNLRKLYVFGSPSHKCHAEHLCLVEIKS